MAAQHSHRQFDPATGGRVRAWRTADGFLVDVGPGAQAVVSGIFQSEDEARWGHPHDYALVDGQGEILERFRAQCWSVDDELGATVFAVSGGSFHQLRITVARGDAERVERVLIPGLEAVNESDDAAMALCRRWVRKVEPERPARAVPDEGFGPRYAQAGEVLRARVEAWGLPVDQALLEGLQRFGDLRRALAAPPESFLQAFDSYVTGCLMGTFTIPPERPEANAAPEEEKAHGFAATLRSLVVQLLDAADGQDWCDARLNAIALRAAAGHVAQAQARLAALGGY